VVSISYLFSPVLLFWYFVPPPLLSFVTPLRSESFHPPLFVSFSTMEKKGLFPCVTERPKPSTFNPLPECSLSLMIGLCRIIFVTLNPTPARFVGFS